MFSNRFGSLFRPPDSGGSTTVLAGEKHHSSIGRGASPPGFPDRFGRQCASGVMEEQRDSGNPQNGIRNGPLAEAGRSDRRGSETAPRNEKNTVLLPVQGGEDCSRERGMAGRTRRAGLSERRRQTGRRLAGSASCERDDSMETFLPGVYCSGGGDPLPRHAGSFRNGRRISLLRNSGPPRGGRRSSLF